MSFLNYNSVECLGEMVLKEKNLLVNNSANLHTQFVDSLKCEPSHLVTVTPVTT